MSERGDRERQDEAEDVDDTLGRVAEILSMWRGGQSESEIAAALDLPVAALRSMIDVLVSPEERNVRRAKTISRSQQRFSDEDLIGMLRACAVEYGKTPGSTRFDRWVGHFWAQLLLMRFGSWAAACERAGLAPNERPPHLGLPTYSEEDQRRAYFRIKDLLDGRTVSVEAWNKHVLPSEPKEGTLRRQHGGWLAFRRAMELLGPPDVSSSASPAPLGAAPSSKAKP